MSIAKEKKNKGNFHLFHRSVSRSFDVREKQFFEWRRRRRRRCSAKPCHFRTRAQRRTKTSGISRKIGWENRLPAAEHFALIFRFANETTRVNGPRIVGSFSYSFPRVAATIIRQGAYARVRGRNRIHPNPFRLFSRLNHGEIGRSVIVTCVDRMNANACTSKLIARDTQSVCH